MILWKIILECLHSKTIFYENCLRIPKNILIFKKKYILRRFFKKCFRILNIF